MVLVLIGIAVGILIIIALIIKATKTSSRDVWGLMYIAKSAVLKHMDYHVQNVKKEPSHLVFNFSSKL